MGRRVFAAALCALALGCQTVTVNPAGTVKRTTAPTVAARKSFFIWGLVGNHRVDAVAACSGRKPVQMQAQTTFVDAVLGIVTFGIYSPRSVRFWCE
jgi:hypothetical protein